MSVINTNILSLNAQRNLGRSQGALAQSLERLSSGLRINSAKDDSSGLAISERFTSQIRGQQQAVRNANDGVSLAQIGEGSLATVAEALQRIRELSVQAANDTNSASDREALNSEAQALIQEIGRVADSTEFAGRFLLNGSVSDQFFQVGANQGQNLVVQGVDARSTVLGRNVATGATASGGGLVTQTQISEGLDFNISGGNAIIIEFATSITASGAAAGFGSGATVTIDISGAKSLDEAVSIINRQIERAAAGEGQPDDDAKVIRGAVLSAALVTDDQGQVSIDIRGTFKNADPSVQTTANFQFQVRGGLVETADGNTVDLFAAAGAVASAENITDIDIGTRSGAIKAIALTEGALDQISSLRARFGAIQSRFESTISNLNIAVENTSAARSRILDADFAVETAELTRAQILQQAGTSVLAQANTVPQSVLSLLQ
jgi:flagellin